MDTLERIRRGPLCRRISVKKLTLNCIIVITNRSYGTKTILSFFYRPVVLTEQKMQRENLITPPATHAAHYHKPFLYR